MNDQNNPLSPNYQPPKPTNLNPTAAEVDAVVCPLLEAFYRYQSGEDEK